MKEAHANMYFSNLFTPDLNISDFKLKNEICCKFGIRLNLYINLGRRDTLGFPVHKLVSLFRS